MLSGLPINISCDLRRAVRAAARVERDLAQALRALLRRRVGRRLLARAREQGVHGLHDEEEDRGADGEERDQGVDERPVGEARAVDREVELAEVVLADDRRDQRRDHVPDERVDDRAERSAHDDADREVDDVAPQKELLELASHRRQGYPSRRTDRMGPCWASC